MVFDVLGWLWWRRRNINSRGKCTFLGSAKPFMTETSDEIFVLPIRVPNLLVASIFFLYWFYPFISDEVFATSKCSLLVSFHQVLEAETIFPSVFCLPSILAFLYKYVANNFAVWYLHQYFICLPIRPQNFYAFEQSINLYSLLLYIILFADYI